MKRVYLFYSAGMSTSMLASRIRGMANSHNLPIEVKVFPGGRIGQIIDKKHPDVILLDPQVKYRRGEIVERCGSKDIPIQVIDQADYDMMNDEKVLKSAIEFMKLAK